MCKFMPLCIILFWTFCFVEGQEFEISTEFINGSLVFKWTNVSTIRNKIVIYKDSKASNWIPVEDDEYTVDNVTQYKSLKIVVREYKNPTGHVDYQQKYSVVIVESEEGESKNISWTIDGFSNAGSYDVFHTLSSTPTKILSLDEKSGPRSYSAKYIYHSQPYSTNIKFEVKNITMKDAGYYSGGIFQKDALDGKGVILAVKRKPEKTLITGDFEVNVNETATLTCNSKSASVPAYYANGLSLLYVWYRNETQLKISNRKEYSFMVSKALKHDQFFCEATEKQLKSERSQAVQIIPLYGPKRIIITPPVQQDKLTVPEGGEIGSFNCSADCNPPCKFLWQYKSSNDTFLNALSMGGNLLSQKVNRDMVLFQCMAQWEEGDSIKREIKLDIQYISDPKFYLNGYRRSSVFTISEKNPLVLSCKVEGNPTAIISVTRIPDLTMPGTPENGWFNHTFKALHCSDTGTYNCKGNSFETKETNITINVTCTLSIDTREYFKPIYGSMSGTDITLKVKVPVISNPPPSAQEISWTGPGTFTISQSLEERENVAYKQWVLSTIPVKNKTYFGNYTMKYRGRSITTIMINAEDKPEPPLNFSWYSYVPGYINLTWVSNFNGGPEQFFILSRKEGPSWTFIKNRSDPGAGKMGYYDLGPLTPGQEYWYQLESCNRINCSLSPRVVQVKVKAPPISSISLFGDNTMLILVGASAAGFLLVVILTVVVTMYCKTTKKSASKKRNRQERPSGSTVQESTPADVVVYAAVDKSVLMKNRQHDDVVKSDVIKDQNDDNDTVYSEVIKHPKKRQTDEKKEKKKNEENGLQGNNEEAEASTSNDKPRSTNQDGLVYIDVEFARKTPSSDTKGRPVIHGEEEKTEYTFVDFSQKAPPVQETQENVK